MTSEIRKRRWKQIALGVATTVVVFQLANAGLWPEQGPSKTRKGSERQPSARTSTEANPYGVQFRDVTKQSGIHFHHERAASDQRLYLETMGAGVAWIDYNRDGFLDAFFVNSGYTPFFHPEQPPQPALYRNNGAGPFTDDTQQAGIRPDGTFFFGV